MANLIARFVNEDSGQDLIEYALIGGLIAVAAVTAITLAGADLKRIFEGIQLKLSKVSVV